MPSLPLTDSRRAHFSPNGPSRHHLAVHRSNVGVVRLRVRVLQQSIIPSRVSAVLFADCEAAAPASEAIVGIAVGIVIIFPARVLHLLDE